jgi:hypothetical protein
MIVELGNTAAVNGVDNAPKVTTIHIPEGDGGHTHKPGAISVAAFRAHRADAIDYNGGVTHLPDNEALLSIAAAWPTQSIKRPSWAHVIATELTTEEVRADLEGFLKELFQCGDRPADYDVTHYTRFGPPGTMPPSPRLPDATALYLNGGRGLSNVNDGGGQVGATGTGTAATATSLTTNLTLTTNQWAGYRIYVMQTAAGPLVWGNVLSNTNAAGASVVTVDRWYVAATPGGSAAATPTGGYYFMLADGGQTSAWFVGLSTSSSLTPAVTDTTLASEYTTAGGGLIRKIAPYAVTSGTSPRSITLTPVFTGNGSDTYPSTFYGINVSTSIVPGSVGCMKFEDTITQTQVAASGDQLTVTETINGS